MQNKIYYFYQADAIPYAMQWFTELKQKHINAGFEKNTFLREGYLLTMGGAIQQDSNWFAAPHLKVAPEHQQYVSDFSEINLICAPAKDLLDLNKAAENYYRNPESLCEEDKKLLYKVEGILLHEIYHCIKPRKIFINYTAYITSPVIITALVTAFFTHNAMLKTWCISISNFATFSFFLSIVIIFILNIISMRRNEYEADMHLIKYGNENSIQGFIDFLKIYDHKLEYKKIFKNFIMYLNIKKDHASKLTKSFYTALLKIVITLQDFYVDIGHPDFQTRYKYLSAALGQ